MYCQCGRKREEHSNEAISSECTINYAKWIAANDAEISQSYQHQSAGEMKKIHLETNDKIVCLFD